jgi:hypothetical protein
MQNGLVKFGIIVVIILMLGTVVIRTIKDGGYSDVTKTPYHLGTTFRNGIVEVKVSKKDIHFFVPVPLENEFLMETPSGYMFYFTLNGEDYEYQFTKNDIGKNLVAIETLKVLKDENTQFDINNTGDLSTINGGVPNE